MSVDYYDYYEVIYSYRLGWQPGDRYRDRDGRDHDYRSDRDARDVRAPGGGSARGGDRFEFQPGGRPSSRDRDRRTEWPDRAAPDPRRTSGERGFSPRYLFSFILRLEIIV